jgi:AbrB family looped-hinge helix DNA binding protein|tara:strand:- start:20 stop:217 length:198 start_codon:yes stop_codon:yes gene_type:complete
MTIESIYKKEEIFSNVDKETGTVDMTIPEEVRARMGWKVGDTLHVKASEDGTLEITKKEVDDPGK